LILDAHVVFTGHYASRKLGESPAKSEVWSKNFESQVRGLQMAAEVYEKLYRDGRTDLLFKVFRELLI
jgi:hypothetical protein